MPGGKEKNNLCKQVKLKIIFQFAFPEQHINFHEKWINIYSHLHNVNIKLL